jgi:hypothetical protein
MFRFYGQEFINSKCCARSIKNNLAIVGMISFHNAITVGLTNKESATVGSRLASTEHSRFRKRGNIEATTGGSASYLSIRQPAYGVAVANVKESAARENNEARYADRVACYPNGSEYPGEVSQRSYQLRGMPRVTPSQDVKNAYQTPAN